MTKQIPKVGFLIFPTHLFEDISILEKVDMVFIAEDPLFFCDNDRINNFNKLKLMFHRASMTYYNEYLKENKINVKYLKYKKCSEYKSIYKYIADHGINYIYCYDPVDHLLEYRIMEGCKSQKLQYELLDNPNYLESRKDLDDFMKTVKKQVKQTSFYLFQRKRLNILMTKDKKPVGGKLTYDNENRQPYNYEVKLPKIPPIKSSVYAEEAAKYIEKYFPHNYGNTKHLLFPTNHIGAKKWFKIFLKQRLKYFGKYQDAFLIPNDKNMMLFHSGVSPMFNVGLITQKWMVEQILRYRKKYRIPINSVEGLIRQLIGWNSFNRLYYYNMKYSLSDNFFGFKNKMTSHWWSGNTGIRPVDDVIKSAFKYGYLHHIQRLMIMLNFQLLCNVSYTEIYRWHMEYSCDGYDQFMIYNVYSMGYADGGKTTTKPYISSSAYICRMSDYSEDEKWTEIWDALYYRFIYMFYDKLADNPRFALMISNFDKKSKKEIDECVRTGSRFIEKITYT